MADPTPHARPLPGALSALHLARLSLRAEEDADALWWEHRDVGGGVPPAIAARMAELSRLSDRLGELALGARS